jgi:hypothetical protein
MKKTEVVQVALDLSSNQAMALAQFVKRVGWYEMQANAVDNEEAYLIRDALERLRDALAHVGYAPLRSHAEGLELPAPQSRAVGLDVSGASFAGLLLFSFVSIPASSHRS